MKRYQQRVTSLMPYYGDDGDDISICPLVFRLISTTFFIYIFNASK